ncbi:MAG: 4Fe-4S dicluster domain-containing protein [Candidatus Thorarchaeota archaeon]
MTQFGFYFDQTRCIGCHTCAIACKDWNDIDTGPVNWMRVDEILEGKFPNLKMVYLSIACNHCFDPPCIKVCPTKAITKTKSNGIVLVNQKDCIGYQTCGAKCLKACPWDAPQFADLKMAKMQKCNLCYDRLENKQQTICVEACPMYAIDVGPIEKLKEKYKYTNEAEGFIYNKRIKPSIIFNPKIISK